MSPRSGLDRCVSFEIYGLPPGGGYSFDPLSALDSDVGQHVLTHCIHGLLRDRTVVLVTHHFHALRAADCVVVLKDGCVVEHGSPAQLASDLHSEYARLRTLRPLETTSEGEQRDLTEPREAATSRP